MGLAIRLYLSGMMQGYSESRFIFKRETKSVPTQRAVIGMIAAAEGILRDDAGALENLKNKLHIVKIESTGTISTKLTDFQTVRPVENSKLSKLAGVCKEKPFLTASGSHKEALPLFEKEYITNDNFTVYVAGKEDEIMKAAEASQRPVFPVYLGRKCCPPAQPVFGGLVDI